MRSFLMRLVFCVRVDGKTDHFDEQLRLIAADNEHEAFLAAELAGGEYSEEFRSADGSVISWNFIGVTGCQSLHDQATHDILFAASVREADITGYLSYVHTRWQHLLKAAEQKSVAEHTSAI